MTANTTSLNCRLLCAATSAYGIDTHGHYTPPEPYNKAVGWLAPGPVAISAGEDDINACLLGATHDGIVLAFRGTLPPDPVTVPALIDWWQDIIDSQPKKEGHLPGKVHHGFWDALTTLWPRLATELQSLATAHPGQPLLITGHSKGGPLATLAAARLHFDDTTLPQPSAVVTFASPHPGNKDFVQGFPLATIPVTRYENYLDLVPFLPPEQEFIAMAKEIPLIGRIFALAEGWDYEPLGRLRYIEKDHSVVDDRTGLEDLRIVELIGAMIEGEKGFKRIADAHSSSCGGGYMGGTCPSGVCPKT